MKGKTFYEETVYQLEVVLEELELLNRAIQYFSHNNSGSISLDGRPRELLSQMHCILQRLESPATRYGKKGLKRP